MRLKAVVGDLGASLQVYGDTLTLLWEDAVGLGIAQHERLLFATERTALELHSNHFRGADDLFDTIDTTVFRTLWFELPPDWADLVSSEAVAPRRH